MANCPEISIFTDEDPFVYYARYLINSFRNTYGAGIPLHDGKNVFEYSSELYDSVDAFAPAELRDLSSVKAAKVIASVNWDTSLPLYIKGPGWGTTVFSEYSEVPWDVRTDDKEGWFDLAGSLIVHPMLRLDHDAYAAAFEPSRPVIELPWDDHFRGTSKIKSAFPLGSPFETAVLTGDVADIDEEADPRSKALKFGFILEVLDAFIHIHDEAGGTLIQPDMESITWCQMFWSGYESEQGGIFKHLGKGSRVFSSAGADAPVPAWEGVFDFYSLESGYVAIEYIPRRDVGYTTEGWASERFIEPELVGPIHSTSAFVGSSLAAGSGFDVTPGIQGHSVKINNAGYAAFVRWLRMALELLDEGVLGPVVKGPARASALTAHDDFLSQVFIDGGAAPRLSVKQCQETGAPYGGLVNPDPFENNCNIKVFRAMADLLYFNENPASNFLDDADLDYWNKFLDEHSVSISLSTEALNEAILGSGVDGYCDAAVAPDEGTPDLDFQSVFPGQCRIGDDDLGDLIQEPFLTCIPDPQAVVPNWLNQPEGEPFFNKKVCEYSIVMLADPPECSEEYFASFIPDAINQLLDYYNKELSTDFLNLSSGAVTPINSKDVLIDGSSGLYLDALVFSGTAKVRNFYIPPRPLAKTKVLITVSAEEFNRIPEREAETEEATPFPDYLNGEPSFVVFSAEEMKSLFDKVSDTFIAYDRLYAKWHLETGKTIKGLNFKDDSKRLSSFYKETELLLKQAGFRLSDLQWVEIGFSPLYEIEYVKVQKPGSSPVKIGAGFSVYKNKAPMIDKTAASYASKLPSIADDLMIREPISWYDMIKKYRFPLVQETYAADLSSPTQEGNDGYKEAEQVECATDGSSTSGVFQEDLFGNAAQRKAWAKSQINDIQGALLSQFSSNPCALVDAKILEQQGREDFAMQITDMTLKEYLTSDRFINDLPELLVRGRFDDIESLYGGMLDNLGMCGLIDLIKSAVDCLLNALGYDDAISIILASAIRGMDDEFLGKFIGSLSPTQQELIIASVQESIPGLMPLLAGFVQITVVDENGDTVEPVYDHTKSYTSEEYPLGALKPAQVSTDPPSTTKSAKAKISIKSPPDSAGSLGKEQRAASAQDYRELKDVLADMIMNDLLNLDEVLNVLNNIPGAALAISILKKIDKYCIAPPIIYPPLRDFIQLPGVNIDFCELKADITVPVFPKIRFGTFSGILIENALRVLEELLIRLLILILKKILQIIAEELCKTRVGSDPLNLRGALGFCGDSDVADAALADLVGALGCLTDPTAVGRLVDNVASVITQCELVDLINGEGADSLYALVVEIIKNDPITEPLSECLYDKESVHSFFKSIGVFVDLDQLCINDPADLPVSREVCDNLGLLSVFRATRADALRAKGVDEECIQDQLCVLRDQTVADLEDLMSLLQTGIFASIMPNIMNDATSDNPSLLPADMPAISIAMDGLYNNIMDSMSLSFTDDMIGRRGFLNMVLADSRGRGYNQHLNFQKSILGPTCLNIYGSRGTRTQPPRDEWGNSYENGTEEHNTWVKGPREFTEDSTYWKLPFLFSPLSSQNPDDTPDSTEFKDNEDDDLATVKGRAPALGGLPDKVAGHLQDQLSILDTSFNINNPYTTNLFWFDYEDYEEDEDRMQITVSYDYWTDPPADVSKYSWDGHRVRVQTKIGDLVAVDLSSGVFNVKSSVEPAVAEYKELFLDPFYPDSSVSPDATFQAMIKQRVSISLGSIDSDRNGITDVDRFLSSYESFFGSGDGLTATINSFERISSNILATFAELVADKGSANSPFNYGFDTRQPPRVVYFHDDGEAYEGDIAGAVARYGGSERNPPFYIKPPKSKGFLKIAEKIIPDFTPCEDPSEVAAFPEFGSLSSLCSEFSAEIGEDERAGRKVKGVSTEREAPFDRHLSRASLGVIEGTLFATIRTYTVEVLLKALPVLKYLKLTDFNYGLVLADYIITKMEGGMKDAGRGRRYREKYKDYWWLFLEQVVQNYAIKVKAGIITDQTPEEEEAIEFINQYVKDNWKWKKSDGVVGLNAAKRVAKDRKERWDEVFEDTETGLDTPIIEKCKIILRRYVREEYARTSSVFSKYVVPEQTDLNNIIIKSPLITRGAISSGEGADAGPIDVPNTTYYNGFSVDLETGVVGSASPHPYEDLQPPLVGAENTTPFVLERYVIAKGDSEAANTIKTHGLISNIFDAQEVWGGQPIEAVDEVYFGLRIILAPEALGDAGLFNDYKMAFNSTSDETGYNYKAFSALFRNTIPLAVAEMPIRTDSFSAEEYNDYLQDLVCKLVETPEYKTLFRHCFPIPKYMDLLALYTANAFVPSLARVGDGWAATVGKKKKGGGQWIGFGKSGGMNTWRGDEGMKNSFFGTKIVARQTLEAACETSYDYKDRDYQNPSEVYVENSRPNSDVDPGIKWWQWSSLRPPPCKGGKD